VKAGADVASQCHFDGYGASWTTLPSNPETSLLYSGEQFDSTLLFDYEQFERLTGQRPADDALTTSPESLPTGFVEYLRDNAVRLDGHHFVTATLQSPEKCSS
jgi:hypothetical protein